MSRIGKKPIEIPEGVKIEIEDQKVKISGPKGELLQKIHPQIEVEIKDGNIFVSGKSPALWGLFRSILNNAIIGVTKGFEKKLEIEGIGYKAMVEKENLILNIGFTHPIKIICPEGIKFSVEKNIITVSGVDKQKVGEIAARIRKIKKKDPYKGKGIKYLGEKIRRKEGKKVVATK